MLILFATLFLAAALHASFQLGVSLLTLLSGHSIGSKRSHAQLLKLNVAYVGGVVFLTTLLLASLGFLASLLSNPREPLIIWIAVASLNIGIGGAVMLFYYRKKRGTELWLPRSMAKYLSDRTKKTSHTAEAFTLGMGSVASELFFILGPTTAAALLFARLEPLAQVGGLLLYVFVASAPLLLIVALVGSGHKISSIQRWREKNKRFLQYAAGSGLVILGLHLFIAEVVSAMTFEGVTLL